MKKYTFTHTGKTVEKQARKFCSEDISLIENYEQAHADNFKGWCIHHRLEYLPCQKRWVSKQELIDKGIYFNRPSWELVFMKIGEHHRLHTQNPDWRAKYKDAVRHSEKHKAAVRQNVKKAQEASLNSEKHRAAARQNIKKAIEAIRNSEKAKAAVRQNIKKAIEARRKPFEIDGVRFESQRDAAKHFGVSQHTIGYWLNGEAKTKKHICHYLPKEGLDDTSETSHMCQDVSNDPL